MLFRHCIISYSQDLPKLRRVNLLIFPSDMEGSDAEALKVLFLNVGLQHNVFIYDTDADIESLGPKFEL